MFKLLIITVVFVPILLGMFGAAARRRMQGLALFLGLLLAYNVLYMAMLYYLRIRWVG
jgi:hypothetical protein